VGVVVWQVTTSGALPDPTALGSDATAKIVDIAVLVFREGLESILVLAAVTAGMVGSKTRFLRPVAAGVGAGIVATLLTWMIAVGVVDSLLNSVSALHLQAVTGLAAILVLLVVMNWFFHSVYWSGWISLHTTRKQRLIRSAAEAEPSRSRLLLGMGLLGFSSFYREGFEVVLFLQHYRLRLGGTPVLYGVLLGTMLTAIVAVLTFVAHRKLPYRKMLVATGVLLGLVLLVMVGEQAQEMQLARWLPTTPIPALETRLPAWMGLWFGVSATVETLAAQAIAAVVVLGSYAAVELRLVRARRRGANV
jgi:high-affinity iron transporter